MLFQKRVYQLLVQGRWFSPGIPASSTTKTGRHDIAEILMKVALNTNIRIITHGVQCGIQIYYCTLIYLIMLKYQYLRTSVFTTHKKQNNV
jgi:hypothetical protein